MQAFKLFCFTHMIVIYFTLLTWHVCPKEPSWLPSLSNAEQVFRKNQRFDIFSLEKLPCSHFQIETLFVHFSGQINRQKKRLAIRKSGQKVKGKASNVCKQRMREEEEKKVQFDKWRQEFAQNVFCVLSIPPRFFGPFLCVLLLFGFYWRMTVFNSCLCLQGNKQKNPLIVKLLNLGFCQFLAWVSVRHLIKRPFRASKISPHCPVDFVTEIASKMSQKLPISSCFLHVSYYLSCPKAVSQAETLIETFLWSLFC